MFGNDPRERGRGKRGFQACWGPWTELQAEELGWCLHVEHVEETWKGLLEPGLQQMSVVSSRGETQGLRIWEGHLPCPPLLWPIGSSPTTSPPHTANAGNAQHAYSPPRLPPEPWAEHLQASFTSSTPQPLWSLFHPCLYPQVPWAGSPLASLDSALPPSAAI